MFYRNVWTMASNTWEKDSCVSNDVECSHVCFVSGVAAHRAGESGAVGARTGAGHCFSTTSRGWIAGAVNQFGSD